MESFDSGKKIRWTGRAVVLVALVASVLLLGSGITERERDNATANLPSDADSAAAARILDRFETSTCPVALVVYQREGGTLSPGDIEDIRSQSQGLAPTADGCPPVFVAPAEDQTAVLVGVPLAADIAEADLGPAIDDLREAATDGVDGTGITALVTGGPAFQADLSKVFEGADVRLLITTAGVVALLLLVTYRSPWLWLVPLAVIGVADRVAAIAVAAGTQVFGFAVDGSTIGITSVLVFGAGTNYALLQIARYREELRRHEDRYDAMKAAWKGSTPAILASGGTVILALLCLSAASAPFSTSIGYAGAIGIAVALLYALVVLPAAMTLFGRRLFWPFIPRYGDADPSGTGIWARLAGAVAARPTRVLVGGSLILVALAIPLAGASSGLSQTEQFRVEPESVAGQKVLAESFPAGSAQPTSVVLPRGEADAAEGVVRDVDGVQSVEQGNSDGEYAVLNVVLDADPESEAAFEVVRDLRSALEGTGALIGGADAEGLDASEAAERDRLVVIPLVLVVVLIVLLVLLRSIVAAVLLVTTVVATYASAMGAGWLVFTQLMGLPALDLAVPLLAFLFLVALGVDYNIFLVTRAREEAMNTTTTSAITTALAVTGGVITSAGVLLAAVFTVLGVLPLITLTQLGVVVGIGVLLDTLLVRTLVVPALVNLLGDRFWWPSVPKRTTPPISEPADQTRV